MNENLNALRPAPGIWNTCSMCVGYISKGARLKIVGVSASLISLTPAAPGGVAGSFSPLASNPVSCGQESECPAGGGYINSRQNPLLRLP